MSTILIIEDDNAVLGGLREALAMEHYEVLFATDGTNGERMVRERKPDLVILDLMLPGKNGEDICSSLRADGISTPIIMLTAKQSELDTVLGLELGADDYVKKPFSLKELLARVKVHLRHASAGAEAAPLDSFEFGSVRIDFKGRQIHRDGEVFRLAGKEFDVLRYLVAHEGDVVSRDELLNQVWGYDSFPTTRTVDNYILNIRKKLGESTSSPRHLLTIHTVGYRFVRNPESA